MSDPSVGRLPVWLVHGADDVAVPVEFSDEIYSELKGRGGSTGEVRYTRYDHAPPPPMEEFSDMIGHASYDLIFRDASLYKWLAEQRRAP